MDPAAPLPKIMLKGAKLVIFVKKKMLLLPKCLFLLLNKYTLNYRGKYAYVFQFKLGSTCEKYQYFFKNFCPLSFLV